MTSFFFTLPVLWFLWIYILLEDPVKIYQQKPVDEMFLIWYVDIAGTMQKGI